MGRVPGLDAYDAVISAGFAGACWAELTPGALVLAGEASPELCTKLGAADGQLATLSHIATPAEKSELGADGIAAVNMEAALVAKAAGARGIPFLSVRIIIDRLEEPALSLATALSYPRACRSLRQAVSQALRYWPEQVSFAPF